MSKPLVIIESPFRDADFKEHMLNLKYAQFCVNDSIFSQELPFASHLLYTQSNILNDDNEVERNLGISLNIEMLQRADLVAVYTDRGISDGMLEAIRFCNKNKIKCVYRTLPNYANDIFH
jgi:hypothetical protein